MKYGYYKTDNDTYHIYHREDERNIFIAMAADAEKADFLTKAANQFTRKNHDNRHNTRATNN